MSEEQKIPSVAQIYIHIADQGHYGSTTCSNCGFDFDNAVITPVVGSTCPGCGRKFVDRHVDTSGGGSDF